MLKLICGNKFLICSQYWLLKPKPTTTTHITHITHIIYINNRHQVSVRLNKSQCWPIFIIGHMNVTSPQITK